MSVAAASPRLPPARTLILIALWGLFVLWMGIGTIIDAFTLLTESPRQFPLMPSAVIPFALDTWGLVGAVIFGTLIQNPYRWRNGKRLIFGSMAFAVMLGRLIAGWPADFLRYTPVPGLLIFLLTPFVLLLAGIIVIFIIALIAGLLFSFFVGVPVILFNQIFEFERAVDVYRFKARGLSGYIARAVLWLRNEKHPEQAPDDSKGARFSTWQEIRNLERPVPDSMGFGHLGKGNPFFLKTEKHVLIMASTRSGKGVTLIIPHLLRYKGSAFVLDPKGENAKATGRQRAKLNTRVHYLDPFGISGKPKSRFNPLTRFTPENMEAESKALAAALFVAADHSRGSDHWMASGQQLLATFILFVYISPDIPAHMKDLPQVRRLLLGSVKPTLELMLEMDDAEGLLRDLASSFLATPPQEFGSIVSTAQRQTEILDNPYIVDCLTAKPGAPEVDFKEWHKGTMTVYLCLSAPKFPTFNRWLRLVLTSALDEMTDRLDPPKLPVCFMLDELATLGHLSAVENAVGLAAGYGIQMVSIFQDVAQIKELYRGRWASFIGNSGVRALFNLDDYDTSEYWSKFVGNRLVEQRGREVDLMGYYNKENVSEQLRPLLPSDKIMMDFAAGKMLVLAQGAHPVMTDRIAYFDDSSLNGLWDDPRLPPASGPKAEARQRPSASPPGSSSQPPRPTPPPAAGATGAQRSAVQPKAPGSASSEPIAKADGNGASSPSFVIHMPDGTKRSIKLPENPNGENNKNLGDPFGI